MAFKMKGFPMHNTSALKNVGTGYYKEQNPSSAFQQTEGDLKEWLLGEKGFSQEEADQMVTSGAYTTDSKDFLSWYKKKGKTEDLAAERVDAPAAEPPVEEEGTPMMNLVRKNKQTVNHQHRNKKGEVIENHTYAPSKTHGDKGARMDMIGTITPVAKMKSPVKKNPGTFGVVTKADVEKMTSSERQAYGRKIWRGPGTTEEKYKKLRSLDIELKGHDAAY